MSDYEPRASHKPRPAEEGGPQIRDLFGYAGKTVVVTGCSSGIGEATASALSSLGASVIGFDINDPKVAVEQFVRVDMADPDSIDAAVTQVDTDLRAVFNCAGISSGAGSSELVIRINFLGLRRVTERLLPRLSSGSAVANVSSLDGYSFRENFPILQEFLRNESHDDAMDWWAANLQRFPKGGYSFSKQAMIAYTVTRGLELAPSNVRVNSIGPGITDTPILADSKRMWGEAFVEKVPRPFGRSATPAEQAWPLVFLNSDLASHITAEHVCTDGGVANGMELGIIDGAWFGVAPAGAPS